MSEDPIGRPTLDERRSSRRIEMESIRRGGRWRAFKRVALVAVLVVEYAGVAWCLVEYLPRIEATYRARMEPGSVPEEAARFFRIAAALDGRWALGLAPLAAYLLVASLGGLPRRGPVFDGLCFGAIVLLALAFVFGYLSLAVPLMAAPR